MTRPFYRFYRFYGFYGFYRFYGFCRFAVMSLMLGVALTVPVAGQHQDPAATVSGIVVTADPAAHPARDALVMIAGIDVGLLRVTATDDLGRFTFAGVPPGRFVVSAGKSRYVPSMYGASRRGRPGAIVTVRPGAVIKDVRLEMERGAVIAGRVTDEADRPISGARVRVLGRRAIGSDIALTGDSGEPTTVITDDGGEYRVFNLTAGDYVVGVQQRGLTALTAGTAIGYEPIYYPATPSAEKASIIAVVPGEERTHIDIRTPLARFARIDGRITGMEGLAAPHQITLRPRGLVVSGTILYAQNVRATPDGRFSFTNVPPGDYTILARTLPPPNAAPGSPQSPAPPPSWALADVTVDGADLTDVSLAWQAALTVSGRVSFEGQSRPPVDVRLRVGLRSTPASNVPGPPEQSEVDASGRFTITGVLPGKYWITTTVPANPLTQIPDWHAASAMIDGVDALDAPFEVTSRGRDDVVLTFTSDSQQIDGSVRTPAVAPAGDCPVVAFPVDPRLWFPQSRRIVVRRSNDAGDVLFGLASALPSGEYYVAAAPDLATGEQFDPALLSQLAKTATRLSLQPNDGQTVALIAGGKKQ